MKKRFLALIICIMAVFMCGCTNAPTYSLAQNVDGTVTQMLYLPFVGSELTELGVDETTVLEIREALVSEFTGYFRNMHQNFVTRVNTDQALTTEDKMILIAGCPKLENLVPAYSEIGILYTLNFSSAIHYYYFNWDMQYLEIVETLNQDTSVTQEGFFTDKVMSTGITIYGATSSQFAENQTLAQYIRNYATELLKQKTTLTEEQRASVVPDKFVYSYGTSSSKLHSDADRVYHYTDGMYYHEWDISADNSTREISTWTIRVNNNVWYGVILLAGVVLLALLFLIDYLKKKKNKKAN